MIPSTNQILNTEFSLSDSPSKQHRMVLDGDRITDTCDGVDAMKQTIFKILNTERYMYPIYSWNYGVEFMDLYGMDPLIVCPEVERRIKEALSVDSRIHEVNTFEFDISKRRIVSVSFIVHTIYGDISEEMVVNY